MPADDRQIKLLAKALYEIRLLLGNYLGTSNEAPMPVRVAAHLAYALHNDALAVIDGKEFNIDEAISRIEAVDRILPGNELKARVVESE